MGVTCVCGKQFSERRYLTRHEEKCLKKQRRSKRIGDIILREENDEGQKAKRRQMESVATSRSNLFMGSSKRSGRREQSNISNATSSTIRSGSSMDVDLPSGDFIFHSDFDRFNTDLRSPAALSPEHTVPDSVPVTPPKRTRKITERMKAMLADQLPEGPGPLVSEETHQNMVEAVAPPLPIRLRIRRIFKTLSNTFGISRMYYGRPTGMPDADREFRDLLAEDLRQPEPKTGNQSASDIIHPYPNMSAFLLNRWFWKGAKKTKDSRKVLIDDVLLNEEFDVNDIRGINFGYLDEELAQNPGGVTETNGWATSSISIDIPTGKKETKASKKAATARRRQGRDSESGSDADADSDNYARRRFDFPDALYHRSLIDIVKEVCSSSEAANFHWHPFEEHWTPPWDSSTTERVYGELFSSKAFIDADRKLYNSPAEPGCDLPRVVAALMIYSDATHVAQFGQSQMWPIYAYFGNQSKYDRSRSSTRAGHNVAFLPSLPDYITDFIRRDPTAKITHQLLAHCRRELFHGCWSAILDNDFLEAYKHGIVITCGDGVRRRVYPRIFTYSADYPEKVLIATIRDMGQCPCPRCKIPKDKIVNMGKDTDITLRQELGRKDDLTRQTKVKEARELIYKKGYVVNSDHVEDLLKAESLVPTENAFSQLQKSGVDVFSLLVVDLMHELELGVWKALLQHLIRILHSQGADTVYTFNARFREVAPFGRSTIRKFPYNVADMKKLAARDFEDILQCCIPCFEGLLPSPHNEAILDLLYVMAYWHGLAKLRMHSDSSIKIFRRVTTVLGNNLRFFASETCRHFETYETDSEYQARNRATARRLSKGSHAAPNTVLNSVPRTVMSSAVSASLDMMHNTLTAQPLNGTSTSLDVVHGTAAIQPDQPASATPKVSPFVASGSGKREKHFNLATSKFHALGDYANQIETFGTTDGFSTKLGETRHRTIKEINNRTNFNNAVPQIVKIDTRETVHNRMTNELDSIKEDNIQDQENSQDDNIQDTAEQLSKSYSIASLDEKNKIYLQPWLDENEHDPAFKMFLPCLKAHLYRRKLGIPFSGEELSTDHPDLNNITFQHGQIYSHVTALFNYTSYDVRREQDTINIHSQRRDILLPSFEDTIDGEATHPYWYARVIGIYHAKVFFPGSWTPERMDFLWVRWFGRDIDWRGGPSTLRLDRIGFVPSDDFEAFGFVDPALVIRACHLIPTFSGGRTTQLLGPSVARDSEQVGDWEKYYVMRFVDRDMLMRYLGLGIGHHQAPDFPREDGEIKDIPDGQVDVIVTDTGLGLAPNKPNADSNEPGPELYESDHGSEDDEDKYDEEIYDL